MILVTITNNWAAAQPVSMRNIRDAAALAKREAIPLFFDACRFAENTYFIQRYEDGYADRTIAEIVQEMFSYADGFTISLKKDGLANMGGVLCFRDQGLFAQRYEGIGMHLKERQILCYGNDSYGGSKLRLPLLYSFLCLRLWLLWVLSADCHHVPAQTERKALSEQ